jgi:hypothetical protein
LALAHVEVGTYRGTDANGAPCAIDVTAVGFDRIEHPLNERVSVTIGDARFVLGHPPVVDAAAGVAFFDHDKLQGVLATEVGAKAFVLEMSHAQGHEGPTAFTLIDHDWENAAGSATRCSGLTFVARR